MGELFPGLNAMQNNHPMFVHYPLVLLPLALVFQAWGYMSRREDVERMARWLLYIGAVAALAAAGTGLLAEETVEHAGAAHEVLELHESLMLTTAGLATGLAVLAAIFRKKPSRLIQTVLLVGLLATSIVLTIGADRGGQLVYEFGVGVKPQPAPAQGAPEANPPEHKHDHQH
ncbi:MAG TPA: DUF2231 domain-containing protein [Candidatus Acidoferrales bacterium]|nr:DUF2231 domain-containing protein [Candidatus Acidoferrales bacterium]